MSSDTIPMLDLSGEIDSGSRPAFDAGSHSPPAAGGVDRQALAELMNRFA